MEWVPVKDKKRSNEVVKQKTKKTRPGESRPIAQEEQES